HAVNSQTFPAFRLGALKQPLPGNVRPHVLFYPGFAFIADPASLAGKQEKRITVERNQNVHVAVHDLKIRNIANSAFKAGVFISTDEQRIDLFRSHRSANVGVTPLDFLTTHHELISLEQKRNLLRLARKHKTKGTNSNTSAADPHSSERIHFRHIDQRLNRNLLALLITFAARR